MAKYNIVSLNYMASGKDRGLVNVDIQREKAVYENTYYLGTEDTLSDVCTLSATLSQADVCFDISSNAQHQDLNNNIINKTFAFDRHESKTVEKQKNLLTDNENSITNPLYDICDVCIKSPVQKSFAANQNLPFTDRDVDIYAPTFNEQPIGFSNVDGRAILVTQPLTSNATILNSSLKNSKDMFDLTYVMQYAATSVDTILYKTPDELCSDCSSYGQYFQMLNSIKLTEEQYQKAQLSAFEPARAFTSLKYNYIIDLDQEVKTLKYDDGNMFGIAVKGKNYLDPMYSQQASLTALSACRQYVGTIESKGKVYLKYIDNVSVDIDGNSTITDPTYQKIEEYKPTAVLQPAKHKSNLFSIKIKNLPFADLNGNDEGLQGLQQIKHDIKNIIFDIVKNVCPANTQLFDVFFESE